MDLNNAATHAANAATAAAEGIDTTTKTTTTTETVTSTGFFGKLARALQANPIPTSVATSLGIAGAFVGARNYRQTGSVFGDYVSSDDLGEVASAFSAAFR